MAWVTSAKGVKPKATPVSVVHLKMVRSGTCFRYWSYRTCPPAKASAQHEAGSKGAREGVATGAGVGVRIHICMYACMCVYLCVCVCVCEGVKWGRGGVQTYT